METADIERNEIDIEDSTLFTEPSDPTHEANEEGEALLLRLTEENMQSDAFVEERFGKATWEKIKMLGINSLHKLETSGEQALEWAEKYVPLPQSKLGNSLAAGSLAIVGVLPGGSLLWGVAYIFAKRAKETGASEESFLDMLKAHRPHSAMSA